MDRSQFRHKIQIRVRNYEVDWQGIVHNANYLLYCEVARLEYLKHLGVTVDFKTVNGPSKVVVVRNEIDYRSPLRFDDLADVYTRVSFIRNTSFAMEGLVERAGTGELVSTNFAYHVWLDSRSNAPIPVPEEFRTLVAGFEGPHCEIAKIP